MQIMIKAVMTIQVSIVCVMFCATSPAQAQESDPELVAYINSIKAIDNHAHVTGLDLAHDRGFDQLRCDELPASTTLPPANLRFNSEQRTAYKALFGLDVKTGDDAEIKKIQDKEIAARHGVGFYGWVMEQAGLETCLAT